MEKLKMESVSIAEDSLNKIAELFPNVVTESMGKDGQLHKAIDFDKLKFLLTANQAEMGVVYDDDERYELTWVGKKQAIRGGASHPQNITSLPGREQELGANPKPVHRGRQSGRNETPEKELCRKGRRYLYRSALQHR